jgi:hypothetical protein
MSTPTPILCLCLSNLILSYLMPSEPMRGAGRGGRGWAGSRMTMHAHDHACRPRQPCTRTSSCSSCLKPTSCTRRCACMSWGGCSRPSHRALAPYRERAAGFGQPGACPPMKHLHNQPDRTSTSTAPSSLPPPAPPHPLAPHPPPLHTACAQVHKAFKWAEEDCKVGRWGWESRGMKPAGSLWDGGGVGWGVGGDALNPASAIQLHALLACCPAGLHTLCQGMPRPAR